MNKKSERCKKCNKPIYHNSSGFCLECLHFIKNKETLLNWLCNDVFPYGVSTTIRGIIRDYISSSQLNRCAICGMPAMWNGKELHFILDHIDGDASNNKRENLRLICPNCDSQLSTYKSRNKQSARTFRKRY